MFEVEGYVDQVSYRVRVDGDPEESSDRLERAGVALGTGRVIDVLRRHEGRPVLVTPVGPTVVGKLTDPAGVLAILTAHTEVTAVTGDAPQLMEAGEPGVVY